MELTLTDAIKIYQWCVNKFGTSSPNHSTPPKLILRPFKTTGTLIANLTEGDYDPETNTIVIYKSTLIKINGATALYEMIKTIIHEYIHYLQDLTNYQLFTTIYGYENNPREVEARSMADLYAGKCYRQLFGVE